MFADDESHPIPSVDNLDIVAQRRDGGARLVVIIASPLGADERSQRRLMMKLETYLGFILSPEFAQEFGPPDPEKVDIVVRIDSRSEPAVFDLLRRCEPWTLDNRTTLLVERVDH
jgi:hypothetical protein